MVDQGYGRGVLVVPDVVEMDIAEATLAPVAAVGEGHLVPPPVGPEAVGGVEGVDEECEGLAEAAAEKFEYGEGGGGAGLGGFGDGFGGGMVGLPGLPVWGTLLGGEKLDELGEAAAAAKAFAGTGFTVGERTVCVETEVADLAGVAAGAFDDFSV